MYLREVQWVDIRVSIPDRISKPSNVGQKLAALLDQQYRATTLLKFRRDESPHVIARSFARIHETNLKKQGILALTFVDPMDYGKIEEKDRISVAPLNDLSPQGKVDT